MNAEKSEELRQLICKLSDGDITEHELQRLNSLLENDPEAQDDFLGQVMIDALLEREFEGGQADLIAAHIQRPSEHQQLVHALDTNVLQTPVLKHERDRKSYERFSYWALVPMLLIAVGYAMTAWQSSQNRNVVRLIPVDLSNAGFELNDVSFPNGAAPGQWLGDPAEHVEMFGGLAPLEGRRMLRFVKSSTEPVNVCEVYQLVDVRPFQSLIAGQQAFVEASAFFNSLSHGNEIEPDEYMFEISVYSFSEMPSHDPAGWPIPWKGSLGASGNKILADADTKSWQQVDTKLALPTDTRFLVVKLSAIRKQSNQENEFPGQFVDNVALNLVCSR